MLRGKNELSDGSSPSSSLSSVNCRRSGKFSILLATSFFIFLLLQNCMASPSPSPGKHFMCMPEIKPKTLRRWRIEYWFIWDNTGDRGQKGYLSQKVNISVYNPSTEKHRQTRFSVAYKRHSSNATVRPWRECLTGALTLSVYSLNWNTTERWISLMIPCFLNQKS